MPEFSSRPYISSYSIADELEFESWPETQKELVYKLFGGQPYFSETAYNNGLIAGYNKGYAAGRARGQRE